MYVRRRQLAGLSAGTIAAPPVLAPAPVPSTFARTLAPSSQAARQQADYAAILARQTPRPAVVYYGAPSATQQRAAAAASASATAQRMQTLQAKRSLTPVRATEIAFHDISRRTQAEQLPMRENGIPETATPDAFAVEQDTLPSENDFAPYESVSHGDRALVSEPGSSDEKPAAAVPLIPIAIAAWLLFGG